MKNELNYIKTQYAKNGYFHYNDFTHNQSAKLILKKLDTSQNFEQPDFYCLDTKYNICYLFEHFEFDASPKTSKGSLYRKKSIENDIEITKEANKFIKEHDEGYLPIIKHIETSATKSQWKENFFNVFNSHYAKVEKYKENLKSHLNINDIQFVTIFLIEDKTEFGAYGFHNGKGDFYHIYDFDLPLQKLLESDNIDYFIFLNLDTCEINVFNSAYISEHINSTLAFDEIQLAFINTIMECAPVLKLKK